MGIEDDRQMSKPLNQLISYRLARVQSRLNAHATRILKDNGGLTLMQWRVLVVLNTYDESSVAHITRVTQFDKALISRTVKSLVEVGRVTLHPHQSDLRSHVLTMTPAGRKVFETAAPHMFARQRNLTRVMSDDERELLFDLLDRLESTTDKMDTAS